MLEKTSRDKTFGYGFRRLYMVLSSFFKGWFNHERKLGVIWTARGFFTDESVAVHLHTASSQIQISIPPRPQDTKVPLNTPVFVGLLHSSSQFPLFSLVSLFLVLYVHSDTRCWLVLSLVWFLMWLCHVEEEPSMAETYLPYSLFILYLLHH